MHSKVKCANQVYVFPEEGYTENDALTVQHRKAHGSTVHQLSRNDAQSFVAQVRTAVVCKVIKMDYIAHASPLMLQAPIYRPTPCNRPGRLILPSQSRLVQA